MVEINFEHAQKNNTIGSKAQNIGMNLLECYYRQAKLYHLPFVKLILPFMQAF